ncbi:hypothetical protein BX265_7079 [Streptomyces sp. TLI_235]|nr:hypothetical protein BX265_7079 [Streptomyces sp. TLI_235]
MLSSQEYKEICALRRQGWSVSAIARCLGRDRKTVRAYLKGERNVGARAVRHSEFFRFASYCQQRLDDDPHLRANVLHSEIVELGYGGAYSTFTRALRRHLTRPCCALCQRGRAGPPCGTVEDVQFDWVQLPAPPVEWDCGSQAYLLMGSLTRSGRWRATLAATNDLPHCVEAMDQVLRRLGGTGERWLFDRTPPVCSPAGKVTAAFHEIATYYAASIAIRPQTGPSIPATRARRSVVLHWWDTTADDLGLQAAQDSLDRLAERSDGRRQRADRDAWALLPLPSKPFPARICVQRRVDLHGLVSFEGNFYLLPAGLAGSEVGIRRRLDEPHLSMTTTHGAVIACFLRAPRGQAARSPGTAAPSLWNDPPGPPARRRRPARQAESPAHAPGPPWPRPRPCPGPTTSSPPDRSLAPRSRRRIRLSHAEPVSAPRIHSNRSGPPRTAEHPSTVLHPGPATTVTPPSGKAVPAARGRALNRAAPDPVGDRCRCPGGTSTAAGPAVGGRAPLPSNPERSATAPGTPSSAARAHTTTARSATAPRAAGLTPTASPTGVQARRATSCLDRSRPHRAVGERRAAEYRHMSDGGSTRGRRGTAPTSRTATDRARAPATGTRIPISPS